MERRDGRAAGSRPPRAKAKARAPGRRPEAPAEQPDDEQGFMESLTNEKILALYKIVGEKTGAPGSQVTPEMEAEILGLGREQRLGAARSLKVLSSVLLFDFYPTLVLILEGIAEALGDKAGGRLGEDAARLFDADLEALLARHVEALEHVKRLSEGQRTLEALMYCTELEALPDVPGWLNERYIEPRLQRLDEIASGLVADLGRGEAAGAAVGSMLGRGSKV